MGDSVGSPLLLSTLMPSNANLEDNGIDANGDGTNLRVCSMPIRRIKPPRRSPVLENFDDNFRTSMNMHNLNPLPQDYEEFCLSNQRLKLARETKPIGLFYIWDHDLRTFLCWIVEVEIPSCSEGADHTKLAGPIRDQRRHRLCWAYSLADLVSAIRLLNELDTEFTLLCAWYLCRNVNPGMLKEREDKVGSKTETHCCHGYNSLSALKFIERNGIPREVHQGKFSCCNTPPSAEGELYKIKKIVEYLTLQDALIGLEKHPIVATLLLFTGWNQRKDDHSEEDVIYRGPMTQDAAYVGYHSVLIVAVKKVGDEVVAICKSSNGRQIGHNGYIKVSLKVMVMMVGISKSLDLNKTCDYKPQHLLSEFFSIEVERKEDPRPQEHGQKRKGEQQDGKYKKQKGEQQLGEYKDDASSSQAQ